MRTTISLDDDVARAVEQLRQEEHLGLSEAVNELARRGLTVKPKPKKFVQKSSNMGKPKLPIDSIARLLDEIEGPDHR